MDYKDARKRAAGLINIVNGKCTADVPVLHALIMSMVHPSVRPHATGFTEAYIQK